MEKKSLAKSKNKLSGLLPKAAQASVSFQNPLYSPGGDKRSDVNTHKLKTHLGKAFSGPIFSMIPSGARDGSKNFQTQEQEPTSPKISCMGQIKHKNQICKKKHASLPADFKPVSYSQPERISKARSVGPTAELPKKPWGLKKIFSARRSDASKPPLYDRAPSVRQMRKFASSRETLANFDWTTAQIAPVDDRNSRFDEYSGCSGGEHDDATPFLAPVVGTGGGLVLETRKEINLWKRRTLPQPKPLQLNNVRAP